MIVVNLVVARPNRVRGLLRVFSLATAALVGCDTSDTGTVQTWSRQAGNVQPIRAIVNCANSIGLELNVDGKRVQLSIRYPNERVLIIETKEGADTQQDVFDRVYTNCGVEVEKGSPVPGLREVFQRAFPGHSVETAVEVQDGTLHVRTQDKFMFYIKAEGLDVREAVDAFEKILSSDQPLARGYFAAVRMRQRIHGVWRDSRRFCLNTFFYYVAPVDTTFIEFTAFPLRVTYYVGRVELSQISEDPSAGFEVHLREGFNGVPDVLKEVDGVVLRSGETRRFSFPYDEFIPFNADIDVAVATRDTSNYSIPTCVVRSGVDLFSMSPVPATAPPGSELFRDATQRTPILDRILELQGEAFPPADDRFPDWAEEAFYKRFPHRRPR